MLGLAEASFGSAQLILASVLVIRVLGFLIFLLVDLILV